MTATMTEPRKPKKGESRKDRKQVNVELSGSVLQALDQFIAAQEFPPSRAAVTEKALVEFLTARGILK